MSGKLRASSRLAADTMTASGSSAVVKMHEAKEPRKTGKLTRSAVCYHDEVDRLNGSESGRITTLSFVFGIFQRG